MIPSGCVKGNPVQLQECEYKPTNTGTAPELLAQMIKQIRKAHNQTIESSYVAGTDGEFLQKLSYKILDDYLVISDTSIHRVSNVSEPTIYFIDTDLDGFVDYWSKEDRIPHAFDKENLEEYQRVQIIWGVYLVNFINNHLIK